MGMYKKLNMNNAVKVRLSEAGHKEMEKQHNELYESVGLEYRPFVRKACDDDGYSTFQLHKLMNTFGHLLTCGNPELPFDGCSILIADVLIENVECQ